LQKLKVAVFWQIEMERCECLPLKIIVCYSSYPLATVFNKYVNLIVPFIQHTAHQFLSKSVSICGKYFGEFLCPTVYCSTRRMLASYRSTSGATTDRPTDRPSAPALIYISTTVVVRLAAAAEWVSGDFVRHCTPNHSSDQFITPVCSRPTTQCGLLMLSAAVPRYWSFTDC